MTQAQARAAKEAPTEDVSPGLCAPLANAECGKRARDHIHNVAHRGARRGGGAADEVRSPLQKTEEREAIRCGLAFAAEEEDIQPHPKIPQFIHGVRREGGRHISSTQEVGGVRPSNRRAEKEHADVSQDGQRRGFTTAKLRKLVRKRMRQIGERKPRELSAHCPRIGGATDIASTGKLCQVTLRAKGRWASHIGKIYARGNRLSQLKASQLIQQCRGRDLEEIFPRLSPLA